jgi:hypothetical protein
MIAQVAVHDCSQKSAAGRYCIANGLTKRDQAIVELYSTFILELPFYLRFGGCARLAPGAHAPALLPWRQYWHRRRFCC